jgi:hypothetical protein
MGDVARILIGPLAWLACFSAVYGLHGTACALGWANTGIGSLSLLRLALGAAWIAAIMIQVAILVALYGTRFGAGPGFVQVVSRATGWVGLVATLWTLFPVLASSSCQ